VSLKKLKGLATKSSKLQQRRPSTPGGGGEVALEAVIEGRGEEASRLKEYQDLAIAVGRSIILLGTVHGELLVKVKEGELPTSR
jgi:hypothetical protein